MTNKKTILFVSQCFPPHVTAASFRISETASVLKDDGYDIKILTAFPHRSTVKDTQKKKDLAVVRVPILRLRSEGLKNYFMHYISFMINSIIWGIFRTGMKIDYIIASSPPLSVAFAGWLLARFKNARFILDIRDIWPDSVIAAGHLKSSNFMYHFAKFLENHIYSKADLITCVSERMKTYIKIKTRNKKQVLVLYNGISLNFIKNNLIRDESNHLREDGFRVTYVGNIGYAQNLNLLIEAATKLEKDDIEFILIGEGAVKIHLMKKVSEAGLTNVIFKKGCSKKEAFEYMCKSHALIIILDKRYSAFRMTIPSKVFDYLWANVPILYGIEGEGERILRTLSGNLYFDANSIDSLICKISNLKDSYKTYKYRARKNREFVLKNFTREKMTKKLEEHLK